MMTLATWNLLWFHMNLRKFFLLCKEYHKDFDGGCIESVKPSWQDEHFHNINSIDL